MNFKLLILTLATSSVFAEMNYTPKTEKKGVNIDQYQYGRVGTSSLLIPFPDFNFGSRRVINSNGIDFGIGNFAFLQFYVYGNYLRYFLPESTSHPYIGVGGKCMVTPVEGIEFGLAPNLITGYEFKTAKRNQFVQADTSFYFDRFSKPIAGLTLSYGVGF